MDFANANKVYRKSGGSPTNAFTEDTPGTATALTFVIPNPPEFTADRSHHFSASAPVVLKIVGWIDKRDKDLSKAADQENIRLVSRVVRRVDDGLMSALPGDHGNRESRTQHPKICEVISV